MKLLHVCNEPVLRRDSRFVVAGQHLRASGLVSEYLAVAPRNWLANRHVKQVQSRLLSVVRDFSPDILFIQSPHAVPYDDNFPHRVKAIMGNGRPIVYWEGDAWGPGKRLPKSSRSWLNVSDRIFSVALGDQSAILQKYSSTKIQYVPNVVPLGVLQRSEEMPNLQRRAVFMGSNLMRIPGVTGVPGSFARYHMVRSARRVSLPLDLFGNGWPRRLQPLGYLPFDEQPEMLSRYLVSLGWNHFPTRRGSFSDRLPIALASGQPHITNAISGVEWLPSFGDALHLIETPVGVVKIAERIIRERPCGRLEDGLAMRDWVLHNLTDNQALSFMMREYLDGPQSVASAAWSV